ncbi:MAG: UbiA-like polyprenyltransferase [Bacteroidales bacterium]
MNKYFSLVKFVHTVFALPFAMIGFTLGIKEFSISNWGWLLLEVLICMVAARNSAMGYNRYLDRDIDAKNPRTSGREIPAGVLSPKNVKWFVIINCIVFIVAAFFINSLCGFLSPIALVILLGYSYMKRVSALCHFVLGLSLAIAPIGAYIAVSGLVALAPAIISLIVLLWVSSFDILYSLSDEEFDKENNLHSIPAFMGRKNAMILSGILHALVLPLLVLFYFIAFSTSTSSIAGTQLNWIYIVGASIFGCLLIYQHCIVSPLNLTRLNAAFFTTNGVASIVFALFTIVALIS